MREIVDVEIMEVTSSDGVALVVVVIRIEVPVEDGWSEDALLKDAPATEAGLEYEASA